jgi:hypothetical protein
MGCRIQWGIRNQSMNKKKTLSLFTRLSWLTGCLAFISVITAELYFVRHERAILELGLRDKINFITNYYALGIAESLQRDDDIMLQQIMSGLEQDHDVTSSIVVDGKGEIRYHADPDKVGSTLEDPFVKKSLESGEGIATPIQNTGGRALLLVIPLKAKGQSAPQGAVRLEITYRHIEDEVHAGPASFEMMALGCIFSCIGGVLWGFKRWVLVPLGRLQVAVTNIKPALLEANFPESDDEFGEINKTLNDLLTRLKTEWAAQKEAMTIHAEDERVLVEQLVRGLLPDYRVLLTDKENRVICDTSRQDQLNQGMPHLLDMVNDAQFSGLINTALQKEGEVTRGNVLFEEQSYDAAILRIPRGQSKLIGIVIALKMSKDMNQKKEAV